MPDLVERYGEGGSGNKIFHGDNLKVLPALDGLKGKIKCVFLDPPYNTGQKFDSYSDNEKSCTWLEKMEEALQLISPLLSEDGSLWVTLDDNEAHYFKVMADRVLGRKNFARDIAWQRKTAPENSTKKIAVCHDHLLVWQKSSTTRWNLFPRTAAADRRFSKNDNDGRGLWASESLTSQRTSKRKAIHPIVNPLTGVKHYPPRGRAWRFKEDKIKALLDSGLIYFGENGTGAPSLKRFLSDVQQGMVPTSFWPWEFAGANKDGKKEGYALFPDTAFCFPKPEKLLQRIIHIATNPNDLVLDAFAGSGTTGAVAHKMGRQWIMIESGEQCNDFIVPRMQKVIDGTDQGGISQAVNWQGGGGFELYKN